MNIKPEDVGASEKKEIVRCSSCHSAISSELSRCPYCGQRTTGAEQKVSQLELSMRSRQKASERRLRNQCKLCGKAILPDATLCSKCEAKDRLRSRIIFIALVVVIILGLLYFYGAF
jgi:predicted nucleic acid-binding Zn ribbon protein